MFLLAPLLGRGGTESASPAAHEYRLRFDHTHTGDRLDVVYRRGDQYIPEALDALDHYLRDHRTGDVRHFDPRLFDLLYDLTASLGDSGGEIDVICGCRTPWSNEFLRYAQPAHRRGAAELAHAGRSDRHSPTWDSDCRSCVTQPCACIAAEWGTIAARTSCTSTPGVCAIGNFSSTKDTSSTRKSARKANWFLLATSGTFSEIWHTFGTPTAENPK